MVSNDTIMASTIIGAGLIGTSYALGQTGDAIVGVSAEQGGLDSTNKKVMKVNMAPLAVGTVIGGLIILT